MPPSAWTSSSIPLTTQVLTDRINDNSVEAAIFTGEGGFGITAITDPRYFVPIHGQSIWGNGWQLWYLQPTNEAQGRAAAGHSG